MGGMTELAPSLVELAGRLGIATWYEDWTGRQVQVSEGTLVAVLAALGAAASTEQDRNEALTNQVRAHWARQLPATIVARTGAPTRFWVHVTHGDPAEVLLRLEDGTVHGGVQQVDNLTAPFNLIRPSLSQLLLPSRRLPHQRFHSVPNLLLSIRMSTGLMPKQTLATRRSRKGTPT